MDQQPNAQERRRTPRRRKRTKLQWFKETYLPLIIVGCAFLLILVFIIGSITRALQKTQFEKQQALEASIAAAQMQEAWEKEAAAIGAEAKALAVTYDYEGALDKIASFSGTLSQFPFLITQKQEYIDAMNALVMWEDNSEIPNLIFEVLIADPQRLPSGDTYKKHISVSAFTSLLQQLYENDYVLVGLDDILNGAEPRPVLLPAGKKPVMITQVMVNYLSYMIGNNNNGTADKNGIGIASKLMVDTDGNLTCQYVDATGQVTTGTYDLVPVLESFIYTHPDFSYKGARATLAVTGYEGIFGYRIQADAKEVLGEEKYQQEVSAARELVRTLRDTGYEIACNTYGNLSYNKAKESAIREDMEKWNAEIAPVLGVVNTLVYARNSDIAGANTAYSGAKYEPLQQTGFTRFLTTKDKVWLKYSDGYIRQGCICVTTQNLTENPDLFSGIFDPNTVLGA